MNTTTVIVQGTEKFDEVSKNLEDMVQGIVSNQDCNVNPEDQINAKQLVMGTFESAIIEYVQDLKAKKQVKKAEAIIKVFSTLRNFTVLNQDTGEVIMKLEESELEILERVYLDTLKSKKEGSLRSIGSKFTDKTVKVAKGTRDGLGKLLSKVTSPSFGQLTRATKETKTKTTTSVVTDNQGQQFVIQTTEEISKEKKGFYKLETSFTSMLGGLLDGLASVIQQ